jgi:MFS transporter, DHA2 family, multidrug resistance protein
MRRSVRDRWEKPDAWLVTTRVAIVRMDGMNLHEGPGTGPGSRGRTARHRRIILAVVLLSVFVVSMDNSILYVAIKTLAEPSPTGLGASQGQLQWAVDAYILAFASLLLSAGVAGNRVGHKRVLLTGLTCFGLFSALSAFSRNPGELIACRAVLGVAAALIMPPTLAIVTRVFPGEARAKAIGIWSAVVGAATAIGPLVAGALLGSFWWGSVFLVNVPVVVVVVPALWFGVSESAEHERRRLDPAGVTLATAGLVGVVYGVIRAGDLDSWTTPEAYAPIAAGLVLLGAFAAYERRVSQPALDIRHFRNSGFTASAVALAVLSFATLGAIFGMTFYIQTIKGYSALQTGVCLLPLAVATILFAPRAPALVRRFGGRAVTVVGLLLVALAMLGLAALGSTTTIWYFELIMFIFGAGMAHVITPATAQMVAAMPADQAGTSSAVNNTFRQVGGALGTAVLGSILASVYLGRIRPDLELLPASLRAPAESSITGTLQVLRAIGGPARAYIMPAENAFMHAMRVTSVAGAIAVFVAAVVVFFLAPPRAAAASGRPASRQDLPARAMADTQP